MSYHARTFGLLSQAELEMVAEWARRFHAEGYSHQELRAASEWLTTHEPPRYRADHLDALVRRLKQQRNPPAPPPPEDDPGKCTTCRGAKFLVVPRHPMPPERWYTRAVVCHRCPLGRWLLERLAKKAPAGVNVYEDPRYSLEAYERLNPGWKGQLGLHEEARRAGVRAAALDRVLGMLRRIPREGGEG